MQLNNQNVSCVKAAKVLALTDSNQFSAPANLTLLFLLTFVFDLLGSGYQASHCVLQGLTNVTYELRALVFCFLSSSIRLVFHLSVFSFSGALSVARCNE